MRVKLLPFATTALEGAPGLAARMQKRHQILRHESAQVVRVGLLLIRSIIKIKFMLAKARLISCQTSTAQGRCSVLRKDNVNKIETQDDPCQSWPILITSR